MAPIDRRRALQLTAGSLSSLLAGCLDDQSGGMGTDDGTDDTDRTNDETVDTTDSSGTPGSSVVGVDSVQLGQNLTQADWYQDGAVGAVTLADTDERASEIVESLDLPPDRQAPVAEFFRATEFDRSLVALVESVGPNTCYGTLAVDGLAVERDRLVGSATATATGDACGQAITYVGALVRATFEGPIPDTATFSITNGWDETAEVSASVDSPDPSDLSGHVRPDDDPVVRAPLTCDQSGVERHGGWAEDPPWGLVTDDGEATFALRVDALEAAYGETVTVRLTNVSDAEQHTGNRHKHAVETLTEDGWESVWVADSEHPLGYTDEAIVHQPGEGFEWTLKLTEDGLLGDHVHADSLAVCPDLEPGRYRFVFWEPAVAVAFDLVE